MTTTKSDIDETLRLRERPVRNKQLNGTKTTKPDTKSHNLKRKLKQN